MMHRPRKPIWYFKKLQEDLHDSDSDDQIYDEFDECDGDEKEMEVKGPEYDNKEDDDDDDDDEEEEEKEEEEEEKEEEEEEKEEEEEEDEDEDAYDDENEDNFQLVEGANKGKAGPKRTKYKPGKRIARKCSMCKGTYVYLSQHLKRQHNVKNREKRLALLWKARERVKCQLTKASSSRRKTSERKFLMSNLWKLMTMSPAYPRHPLE